MVRAVQAVALVVVAIAMPPTAFGQDPSRRLGGVVVDADWDELPVSGARVSVPGEGRVVITDADGEFTLEVPEPPFVLEVEAPDYVPIRVPVSSNDDPLVIALRWDGPAAMTETRAAPDEPVRAASSVALDADTIAAAPLRTAEDALRQVPGLVVVQHGNEGKGNQLFLRGFDAMHGADFAVTVEGVPFNEWSNVHAQGYLDLGLVIPEHIEQVDVTKGPFALDLGAFATAGGADYRLGVPASERGFRAAYQVGTTNRHRIYAGYAPADEDRSSFVGVEVVHDDGYGRNRQLRRATINARAPLVDGGHNLRLDLLVLAGTTDFGLVGPVRNDAVQQGVLDFHDTHWPDGNGQASRGVLALLFDRSGPVGELHVLAYGAGRLLRLEENFTGYLADPVNGDARIQRQVAGSWGLLLSGTLPVARRLTALGGVEVHGDDISQLDRQALPDEPPVVRSDLRLQQVRTGTHAGLRIEPHETLQLDTGLRLDVAAARILEDRAGSAAGSGVRAVASPRVASLWRAHERVDVVAAYGRGFRPPDARALTSGDPGRGGTLEDAPSRRKSAFTVSDTVELGARWAPHSAVSVSASGFATFVERESVFDHVSGVSLELAGTRRLGGEVVLEVSPSRWLDVSLDATLVHARFVASGNPVPFAPWLTGGLRVSARPLEGLDLGFRALGLAARDLPHGARGTPSLRVDAVAHYAWRALRLGLEVENVTNARIAEGEYHFASHWDRDVPASALPALHSSAAPPLGARLSIGFVY